MNLDLIKLNIIKKQAKQYKNMRKLKENKEILLKIKKNNKKAKNLRKQSILFVHIKQVLIINIKSKWNKIFTINNKIN
jgi:hypothetical protein